MAPHTIPPVVGVVCCCSFKRNITPNGGDSEWVSMAVQVIGAIIATVLQAGDVQLLTLDLHDESDLRVSRGQRVVCPYSATVLVALSLAPDHRPPLLR
ncbi:hypothetical protein TNCV_1904711 [Trichonephila clavipes]|nr:hypothetical protein TNCV_1904711 [Trichonephila clavipes]